MACIFRLEGLDSPATANVDVIPSFVLGGEGYIEKEAVVTAWFDLHACLAAIVRPDHYVYCGLRDASLVDQACHDLQERLLSSR
jgi:3-(3-hydroxy-phenyl)propionate hydroxylase